MSPVSRGFHRKRDAAPSDPLPPRKYSTRDFPGLTACTTPPSPEPLTTDIHCVTRWSKLDTTWQGVSLDVLLAAVEYENRYALAFSDGGYTTNLPVGDLLGGC